MYGNSVKPVGDSKSDDSEQKVANVNPLRYRSDVVCFTAYGDASKVCLIRKDLPLKSNQIAIKVVGCALNPVDFKRRNGVLKSLYSDNFPAGLGYGMLFWLI